MRRLAQEKTSKAHEKADRQLAKMAPLRTAMSGFDGNFWKFVTERLEQKLSTLRWARSIQNVAQFKDPSEAGLRLSVILAQEEAIESIKSLPQEISAVLKMMEEEYRKTCAVTGDEGALEKNKL